MEAGKVLLWVLGGSVVVGGIAYAMASKKTPSSTSTTSPSDACSKAAEMAALARADPANASDFSGPYAYWANLCRSQGGSPPPFPT
jgi:hypothetical protein